PSRWDCGAGRGIVRVPGAECPVVSASVLLVIMSYQGLSLEWRTRQPQAWEDAPRLAGASERGVRAGVVTALHHHRRVPMSVPSDALRRELKRGKIWSGRGVCQTFFFGHVAHLRHCIDVSLVRAGSGPG